MSAKLAPRANAPTTVVTATDPRAPITHTPTFRCSSLPSSNANGFAADGAGFDDTAAPDDDTENGIFERPDRFTTGEVSFLSERRSRSREKGAARPAS
ncbi:hypothetical protein [Actinomadura atramentaria]|uniref:hypothetical protein n=1 Tax=Actinomadura atramentaria TaxID=1990 RepID=UPI00146C8841|nr:hypothetical protein [Actinomadura atramentaria]